jgi:hypothetical protein
MDFGFLDSGHKYIFGQVASAYALLGVVLFSLAGTNLHTIK